MLNKFWKLCFSFCLSFLKIYSTETTIDITKNNVLHKFVPVDKSTDNFVKNIFPNWETDTFFIFDLFKDKNSVAIDLGAWIGTTSIWLSHNFHHVVAVEADKISLTCLENNLKASACSNVSICKSPVGPPKKSIIFGPKGSRLNESTSQIKSHKSHKNDYVLSPISFKQILYDYVLNEPSLKGRDISFIKCDIEGGEEYIIEDVLHFAFYNKVPVWLSFHIDWWNEHHIEDYAYLFDFFEVSVVDSQKQSQTISNVIDFLKKNPFGSLLFQAKKNSKQLIKKNITAVIIGFNLYSMISQMVNQLKPYTSDIIIIDNNSSYPPLLDYYEHTYFHTLLKRRKNDRNNVWTLPEIQKLLGDVYIITDPDLLFNPLLPKDFIQNLVKVSNYFQTSRVGFALDIFSSDLLPNIKKKVIKWENKFWEKELKIPGLEDLLLYEAAIDTTFCLVNNQHQTPWEKSIRIAGNYTCKHLPWHNCYQNSLLPGEANFYFKHTKSSYWRESYLPTNKSLPKHPTISFPKQYWLGAETLQRKIPWWTPESVIFVDAILNSDDVVVEYGSGGSSLFFAKRCKKVLSFETNPQWAQAVQSAYENLGFNNISLTVVNTYEDVNKNIDNLIDLPTVICVDSDDIFNRDYIQDRLLLRFAGSIRLVIVDNYAETMLFPRTGNMDASEFIEELPEGFWSYAIFNDAHWRGNGTRVFIKN